MIRFAVHIILFLGMQMSVFGQLAVDLPMAEHAVLQRDKIITLQGTTSASSSVYVIIDDHRHEASTDMNGKWAISLPPKAAGGPHKVSITNGRNVLTYIDIWYGDVWLASGQSNMEWSVNQSANAIVEKQDAEYPLIREFYVDHEIALSPVQRLTKGSWVKANKETVGKFSAVAFYFARKIWKETNIPIGIIHSSWGGSQAESWISIDAMKNAEHLKAYAASYTPDWFTLDSQLESKIAQRYLDGKNQIPTADDEAKYITDPNLMMTRPATFPMGSWDWKGASAFRGAGYMSTYVDIAPDLPNQPTELSLGSCHCRLQVYVNGKEVANEIGAGLRKFKLPPNTWATGQNYLLIKIGAPLNEGWKEVGIHGKESELSIQAGEFTLPLAGLTWHHIPAFGDKHYYEHWMNNAGSIIYNAMIAPICHYTIKGTIWYQGESNAGRASEYDKTMNLLINSWREKWGKEMPFYFVELSSYGPRQNSNEGSAWAELRESQKKTDDLMPHTERVTTIDIGNAGDIHPTNKQDVGYRLAAFALRNDYGINDIDPDFPTIERATFKKGKALLVAKSYGGKWSVKDENGEIRGFELKDANGKWHFGQATIDKKQNIVVSNPLVSKTVAVRYAWADAPTEANLFGANGLPLRPYRSDNDKSLTEGVKF